MAPVKSVVAMLLCAQGAHAVRRDFTETSSLLRVSKLEALEMSLGKDPCAWSSSNKKTSRAAGVTENLIKLQVDINNMATACAGVDTLQGEITAKTERISSIEEKIKAENDRMPAEVAVLQNFDMETWGVADAEEMCKGHIKKNKGQKVVAWFSGQKASDSDQNCLDREEKGLKLKEMKAAVDAQTKTKLENEGMLKQLENDLLAAEIKKKKMLSAYAKEMLTVVKDLKEGDTTEGVKNTLSA